MAETAPHGSMGRLVMVAALWILLIGPAAAGGPGFDTTTLMAPDPRIWAGEISYTRVGGLDGKEETSIGGKTGERSKKREVKEQLTIGACGEAGILFVTDVAHSLSDETTGEGSYQAQSAQCGKHDIRRPGSSSGTGEKRSVELYEGKGVPTQEEMTSVFLHLQPGGYRLVVANRSLVATTSDSMVWERNACTGREKRTENHVSTGALGTPYDAGSTGSPEDDISILWETWPPAPHEAGFTVEGQVTVADGGDVIQGGEPISEKVARTMWDYGERTTAEWYFTAEDPCPKVYDALNLDLATAEAYADEGIRAAAGDMKSYENAVAEEARRIAFPDDHGGASAGTGSPPIDIGTNSECRVVKEDEHRETIARQCEPPVIFRKDLAHEKVHVSQCRDRHDAFLKGVTEPATRGAMETEGYIRGVEVLLVWFDDNRRYCPESNYPTAQFRQRLERIRGR